MSYFEHIPAIRYEGPQSDNPLAYHHYDPEKRVLGKTLAERAKKAGVGKVVFDRGGFLFHGRVKALADAACEGGLEF